MVFDADGETPLLVVETKACGFSNGAPVEQAERYARVLDAKYIAIACSDAPGDIAYYKLTTKGYKQLSQDPTYKDLIGRKRIQYMDNPIAESLSDEDLWLGFYPMLCFAISSGQKFAKRLLNVDILIHPIWVTTHLFDYVDNEYESTLR